MSGCRSRAGQLEHHHVEPVIEVAPEFPLIDQLSEVLLLATMILAFIGSGRLVPTGSKHSVFDYPEELLLGSQRQGIDLVQDEGPFSDLGESTHAISVRRSSE